MCESIRASQHNSVDAHLGYTEADEEAHGKGYRAMGTKTNSYQDKKAKTEENEGNAMEITRSNTVTGVAPAATLGVNALGMGGMGGMGMGRMNAIMQHNMCLQMNIQIQMLQQQQQQMMMNMGMDGMSMGLGVANTDPNAEPYISIAQQDPNIENVGGED